MKHKITLPQLKKYDITQKVIEALADAESRTILFSIIHRGKTASNLSDSLKIPLSSVYKKISDLEHLTLIKVEKTILSEKGRRFNSHAVLFSIINTAKDAIEISDELQISLSSTYKALTNLESLSLVEIERFKITDIGKKIKLYRSRIKKASISISEGKSEVTLYPNN